MFQRNFHLCHLSHFTSFQNFASYIFGPKLPFPQILRVNIVDVGFFYSYQSPSLPIKTKAQLFKSIHSGQDRGTGQVAVARSSVLHRWSDQRAKLQNEGNDSLPLWAGYFAYLSPPKFQNINFADYVVRWNCGEEDSVHKSKLQLQGAYSGETCLTSYCTVLSIILLLYANHMQVVIELVLCIFISVWLSLLPNTKYTSIRNAKSQIMAITCKL